MTAGSLVWLGVGVIALVLQAAARLSVMVDWQYLRECRKRGIATDAVQVQRCVVRLSFHEMLVRLFVVVLVVAVGGMIATW